MKWTKVIKAEEEKIPAIEVRSMNSAIHHLITFNTKEEAIKCFEALENIDVESFDDSDEEDYFMFIEWLFRNSTDDIEVDHRTIRSNPKYDIVNKHSIDVYFL